MTTEFSKAPEASCLCSLQGGIQAHLRPAAWIPGIRSLHMYEEKWMVSANPVVCSQDVLQAVSQLRSQSLRGNVFTVSHIQEDTEKSAVEIVVYTRLRYVLVLSLEFMAGESSSGSIARARSFVSGIMPAWFPLCFIFSALFFFLPFPDCGFTSVWLNVLRKKMTVPVEVTQAGRKL